MTRRLLRSKDGMIGGVCSGIAKHLYIDPTIVRLIFLLGTFFTIFPFILTYIILWIIVPVEN